MILVGSMTGKPLNPQAFPRPYSKEDRVCDEHREPLWGQEGMTLRDWFAGQVMSGFCADPNCAASSEELAESAYAFADAMLAERERRDG